VKDERVGPVDWNAIDRAWFVNLFGGGAWGGYWYCVGCGNPQLGDPPWGKVFGVRDRCRPCGPGRGYVPCPATHGERFCGLCRGERWVEELT